MSDEVWIEIRDRSGRLLFKYDPRENRIEIKKGGDVYTVVKLDEIRQKHGYLPSPAETNTVTDTVPGQTTGLQT